MMTRPWTHREDKLLRFDWGALSLNELAAKLDRTPYGVYDRASVLGLSLGIPQGCESIEAAAKRLGICRPTLRRMLAMYKYQPRRTLSKPNKGIPPSRWFIESDTADEVVRLWLQTEPVQEAAERRGIVGVTLRQWLIQAGHKPYGRGKVWRVDSKVIDDLLAARALTETVQEGAFRIGTKPETLRKWLRKLGIPNTTGRRWRLPKATVDQVAEEMRRSAGPLAFRKLKAA